MFGHAQTIFGSLKFREARKKRFPYGEKFFRAAKTILGRAKRFSPVEKTISPGGKCVSCLPKPPGANARLFCPGEIVGAFKFDQANLELRMSAKPGTANK